MRSRGAGKKSEKCEFPGDGAWFRVQMGDARLGIGMGGRWACCCDCVLFSAAALRLS